jgi:hypothetical protein
MQPANGTSGSLKVFGITDNPAPQASVPIEEYLKRLATHTALSGRLNKRHIWIGNVRLVVFILILILCWKTSKAGGFYIYGLAGAVVAFIGLGGWDGRTVRARNHANRAASFYRRGQERIEDRWSGSGEAGREFQPEDHLYAEDLNILGEGSLFQLLCVARTQMGKARLAEWLLAPAGPGEVEERQTAVNELAARLDLREDLAALGESEQIKADGAVLVRWARKDKALDYRRWWIWIFLLAALSIPTLIYGVLRGFWTPFLLVLVANWSIAFGLRHRLEQMFAGLDQASRNLNALACLLKRVEQEDFNSPRNLALRAALLTGGLRASECVGRLNKLSQLADSRDNLFVKALEIPLLYSVHLAFALQRWKDRFAAGVPAWIDSIGSIEALTSVAAYRFEHPADPFPEFVAAENSFFEGVALGHPLLPASTCVRNDVSLHERDVLLVSGSNMSGKSTLLRVVGVNAVLAMMGAPIRASRLRLSELTLGTAINISDSLQKGVSHFYAEIKRIRRVVDLSSRGNVLFLFDEMLQGTNSHDRRIGAEGIVRALIRNGAIGMVTTHDLALTSLAEDFPEHLHNVHFQETLEGGQLHFDYRLREGIVTTSNGIELMKSIGLDV